MKKPSINNWAIVYFILGTAPILFLCFWAVKDGWFPSEKVLLKHPDPADHFYTFNKSLACFSVVLVSLATLPAWIIAFGKQKPWVWTTSLVFIVLGLFNNPLMGIPVLIFWITDKNKAYYGKLSQPDNTN